MITGILGEAGGSERFLGAIESLGAWAWRASWQGAAIAVIVAVLLALAGRRISPAGRFWLWALVLARLAMPAVLQIEWGSERLQANLENRAKTEISMAKIAFTPIVPGSLEVKQKTTDAAFSAPLSAQLAGDLSQPVALEAVRAAKWRAAGIGARRYLPIIWLLGVAILAVRIASSSTRLARGVARMKPIADPRVLEGLRDCCRELKINRVPRARELPGNGAPAQVGFLWPQILLPAHVLRSMAGDELRLILLHELAHVKRGDVLVNWLATMIAVVHWPNPAAWLVGWRMRVERELACDELVLRMGRDAGGSAYARTIVKLVEALSGGDLRGRVPAAIPSGAVGILEARAQIQRRLVMITRFDAKSRRRPVVAAGFGLLVGALALSGVTRAADKAAEKPANSTPRAGAADAPSHGENDGARIHAKDALQSSSLQLTASSPAEEKANARTAEKLQKQLSQVDFDGIALCDAINYIRDAAGIDVIVEWTEIEAMGIAHDTPVTLRLREPTSADAVLSLMFRAMGGHLQHEIDRGVVVIGPSQQNAGKITRVYDVSELISAPARGAAQTSGSAGSSPLGSGGAGAASGGTAAVPGTAEGGGNGAAPGASNDKSEIDQLVSLVISTVQPEVWTENTVVGFKTKLVVRAPESVQKEVNSLLEMLREKPAPKNGAATGRRE